MTLEHKAEGAINEPREAYQQEDSFAAQLCPGHDAAGFDTLVIPSSPEQQHGLVDIADLLNDPLSPEFCFSSPPASPNLPALPEEPCLPVPHCQLHTISPDDPCFGPLADTLLTHSREKQHAHLSPHSSTTTLDVPLPPPPSAHAPTTASIEGLLDDPLNATLITAQLPKRHRTTAHAASARPANPSVPITKPSAKKKKLRPKDRLEALQSHLDIVVDRVKQLSLLNHHLHRKQRILQYFVQDLDQYAALAAQIQADVAHYKANPSDPPSGAAAYQQWTPHQLLDFQRANFRDMTRLMLAIESAGVSASTSALPPAAAAPMEELVAFHQRMIRTTMSACHGRLAFIPQYMELLGQAFPPGVSEEEHWRKVLAAMELTEGQVEDLLVAREVFLSFTDRMEHEQQAAQAFMRQHTSRAATSTDMLSSMHHLEELVLHRMAVVLRRHHGMLLILTMFIVLRTLTPLQVGRCILHAHPLLPFPIVIMNMLYAQRAPATAAPALGPQRSTMATACTLSDMLKHGGEGALSLPQLHPRWRGLWAAD